VRALQKNSMTTSEQIKNLIARLGELRRYL